MSGDVSFLHDRRKGVKIRFGSNGTDKGASAPFFDASATCAGCLRVFPDHRHRE